MAASVVMRRLPALRKLCRVSYSQHCLATLDPTLKYSSGGSANRHPRSCPYSDQSSNRSAFDEIRKLQSTENPKRDDPYFFNPLSSDRASHEMLLVTKPDQPEDAHVLRVAIIGTPNAGKSTLVNSLLGRRIFSVSEKVHTTRAKATAVLTLGRYQIIFLDTPGMVSPEKGKRHQLPRPLMTDSRNVLAEADLVAVMVDVGNKWTRNKLDPDIMMALHENQDVLAVLILNKVDLLKDKQKLFGIISDLTEGVVGGRAIDFGQQSPRQKGRERTEYKAKSQDVHLENTDAFDLSSQRSLHEEEVERRNEGDDILEQELLDESKRRWFEEGEDEDQQIRERDEKRQNVGRTSGDDRYELVSDYQDTFDDELDKISRIDLFNEEESLDGYRYKNESVESHPENRTGFQPSEIDEESVENVDNCRHEDGRDEQMFSDSESRPNDSHSGVRAGDNSLVQPDLKLADTGQHTFQLGDDQKEALLKDYIRNLDEVVGSRHVSAIRRDGQLSQDELQKQKRIEKRQLMQSFRKRKGWPKFQEIFMVSALNDDGTENLKDYFIDSSKPGHWEFHSDTVTDLSPEIIVSEAIREQLLKHLPKEVPYMIGQVNELWQFGENGELQIYQKLICERKSHVSMIKNRKKFIVMGATTDLMNAFHCEVLLKLHAEYEKSKKRK